MPSVKKVSVEVSPWAIREVDRLNDNLEKASGQRKKWSPLTVAKARELCTPQQRRSERMKAHQPSSAQRRIYYSCSGAKDCIWPPRQWSRSRIPLGHNEKGRDCGRCSKHWLSPLSLIRQPHLMVHPFRGQKCYIRKDKVTRNLMLETWNVRTLSDTNKRLEKRWRTTEAAWNWHSGT